MSKHYFNRHFLFRYYWLFAIAGVGIALVLLMIPIKDNTTMSFGMLGGVVTLCYFVQQQQLEHTRLLCELFDKFNNRYAKLNESIKRIASGSPKEGDEDKLIDYFNLCAEEFHFYEDGIVPLKIWRVWCRGMLNWLDFKSNYDVWIAEEKSDTYYDLTLDKIEEAAGRKRKPN